jgi:hypothetical protein
VLIAVRCVTSQQDKGFGHPLHCWRCRAAVAPGPKISRFERPRAVRRFPVRHHHLLPLEGAFHPAAW